VQKYTHDGSRMLLQIGIKGKFDTSVGTISGAPMNSSHERLNLPTQVAVDPADGDVYISDGYGNRRVVVFDREGHFLRQWGRQGTVAEVDAGVGGVFLGVVHCVVIGNDGLVYVCDRFGDRIEVFDKMGNFQRNIRVDAKIAHFGLPYEGAAGAGSAGWVGFSPDPAQKFLYVGTGVFGEVRILDRATGQSISSFGRPGHQSGDISSAHSLAVDSKGNIIVAETNIGRRVQKFKPVK
jgi:DNA-binding beta-propeller fold protein YncE